MKIDLLFLFFSQLGIEHLPWDGQQTANHSCCATLSKTGDRGEIVAEEVSMLYVIVADITGDIFLSTLA